jgi:hypothetical protein
MAGKSITLEVLLERTGLDRRVLQALCEGRYTPSPLQRQRVASALGISVAEIAWGHVRPVSNLYGHGPQFGRTP